MPPKFVRIPDNVDIRSSNERETRSLLDGNSDDEDFFLKGPKVKTDRLRGDAKLTRLQSDVDEVVDIMKTNVARVVDRGDRLEDLQDKSDDLSNSSNMFRNRSKALHRRMWWQNCRMKIILALVIVIIIGIVAAALAIHYSE